MATYTVEKQSQDIVVHKLNELFGAVLNFDVIKQVAVSCHFDVTESSNKLIEITRLPKDEIMYKDSKKALNSSNIMPTTSKKALAIERAVDNIKKGYKVLIIMRGLPGSGKSHLAQSIVKSSIPINDNDNFQFHIFSADNYFYQNNVYQFNSSLLPKAHKWNYKRASSAASKGCSPIIIDNTNTEMWEMEPYAILAIKFGYILEILEPDTHWCFNDKELAKRNLHGVPRSKINEMSRRYKANITPQILINSCNSNYGLQKLPQLRLYPALQIPNSPSFTDNPVPTGNTSVSDYCNSNENRILISKNPSLLNCAASNPIMKVGETFDLMEFNDEETATKSRPVMKICNNEILTASNQNTVDKILMYDSDNINNTSYFLQPSQQNVHEISLIDDSSDEDNVKPQKTKDLFADTETAWGINESALRSWDIVTPLKEEEKIVIFPPRSTKYITVETTDGWCNTEEKYFQGGQNNLNSFVKIIKAENRDINEWTPRREQTVLRKSMLDKSCSTEDLFENYDNHISQLQNMFPSVPKSHLKYLYNTWKGDIQWTVECILDAKQDVSSLIEDPTLDEKQVDERVSIQADSDSSNSDRTEISDFKEGKFKRVRKYSDENHEIKKIIESKIDINAEHYSKHLLKVKQLKFGMVGNNMENLQSYVSGDQSNFTLQTRSFSPEASTSNVEDVLIDEDSDIEFEEFENVSSTDKAEDEEEEIVELILGNDFVAQLEEQFGDPNMGYPKGLQPVVQVPITLARQLYTFYIESVYQQMDTQKQVLDTLVKEDEEFARKLQAKEEKQISLQVKPTTNLQEIINEQVAQSIQQKEAEKWRDVNPDNLAARLTKQKLFNVFPNIDKNTLVEILSAHDNKYQDTVETLLASTGTKALCGNIDQIKEPPINEEVLQEMKEAQRSCAGKVYEDQQEATFYREEANRYLKKRSDLYQKAQQHHQCGSTEIAQYYSGLASRQTVYFDRANNMAATAFLDEHSKRLQDFNTIDLHFLYVKEAIPALDVFLDRNINLLKHSNTKQAEYLQIITGRGKRSENGVSKIKPAVFARLKKRQIKYVVLNPGLLKVKVTKNSQVTNELLN